MIHLPVKPVIQRITDPDIDHFGVNLFIKRDDLIHPYITGNKGYKLIYNIEAARKQGHNTLLTFGGAYSNHVLAVAAAGQEYGFHTIGIIRGEAHIPLNAILQYAATQGMKLRYMDRTAYRNKNSKVIMDQLYKEWGMFYVIPEGGANSLGVKGCIALLQDIKLDFDYVCCACGTGTTLAGLILALERNQKAIGFPVLKGAGFMEQEITKLMKDFLHEEQQHEDLSKKNWLLKLDYHFGGYAKATQELLQFIALFEKTNKITLDPVYTGKMMYGVYDLIRKGFFLKGQTLLVMHTGRKPVIS